MAASSGESAPPWSANGFRQAACGRVIAMLSTPDDAPDAVARRLASAAGAPPRVVVAQPSLRIDVCVVLLLVGVLLGVLWARRSIAADAPEEEALELDGDDDDDESAY